MSYDPITAALNFGGKLLDKFIADPKQKDEAKLKLLEMTQNGELARLTAETDLAKGQIAINAEEAKNPSLFVSGWRPFVGWVCGLGLCMQFLVKPIIEWVSIAFGHPLALPPLDMSTLVTMLGGLLGLGTLRTVEKVKDVARK